MFAYYITGKTYSAPVIYHLTEHLPEWPHTTCYNLLLYYYSTLTSRCQENNLHLNVNKTKKCIVDYRKLQEGEHAPIHINGAAVERVSSFRFLGINISEDLSWSYHAGIMVKAARQNGSSSAG
ncbi:hypothetical protein N1851_033785 [Merluccius polli]|uniref:Uncharacterized protein n=1 Tax=Merluccius polli TaxID=89951 RepID=A0AA47M0Q9_MERPO|nr:hypothetical protein N1851_033785 [Merluccius polli]